MALKLFLTGYEETIVAHRGDPTDPLTPPTPLAALTAITGEANPYLFDPFGLGATLFQAMGGPALLDHLDRDADELLLLMTDDRSAALPWEYAALSPTELLIWRYRLLRLLPEAKAPRPAPTGPLNFIVLAADPLVDPNGDPILARSRFNPAPRADEVAPRLDLTTELNHIHQTLSRSRVALTAQRIPPTERHLAQAVRRTPALLHLSCHGSIIEQQHNGLTTRQPILYLEDDHGQMAPLRGDRLANLVRGKLGLVVISACRTARSEAADTDADLARALVQTGSVPAAIGMQADFPDADSGPFAAALYDSLLLGDDLGESLRQARLALSDAPHAAGLPVAYVAPEAGPPLRLAEGWPQVAGLTSPSPLSLPALLTPPNPLVGRERELHQLARALNDHPVVTVVGTGGIGKTALAASLAARFGWRWPGGVMGVSLAEQPAISAKAVLLALLTRLLGETQAQPLANLTADQIYEHLLPALQHSRPLLLIDNYETVQQALDPQAAAEDEGDAETQPAGDPDRRRQAALLNRLLSQLADAGQPMLLTSRRQPVGLRHEVIFPPDAAGRGLPGLAERAGADLFLQSSSRAKAKDAAHQTLARAVAQATGGHPLAITLLAGEYDVSREVAPEQFLAAWDAELAAAQRQGLAPHHVTFATAFERSYQALPPLLQARLTALRHFSAPFFAEGAAQLWGLEAADAAKPHLGELVRRSLLVVDLTYDNDTPATYRLEPVILGYLGRAYNDDPPGLPDPGPAYAAYAAWLVDRCYEHLTATPPGPTGLAWLDELLAQADHQPPDKVSTYGRQLAWLLRHYGRLAEADPLLAAARRPLVSRHEAALSSVLYEQAAFAECGASWTRPWPCMMRAWPPERLGDLQGRRPRCISKRPST
ncbi:MAG: CHAT domain-containing protein [Anaerolineales bacterium]|nr:CHAT domain-containing protein [Anaerolineales bacterium]